MFKTPSRAFLLLLVLLPLLACQPQSQTPPERLAGTAASSETETMTAPDCCATFSKEIFARVSVETDPVSGDATFVVLPDPIVIQNAAQQSIVWDAADPTTMIRIHYAPKEKNGKNPTVDPPAPPCNAAAPRCGDRAKPVGGRAGTFKYIVSGTQGGRPVRDLDPDVIILKAN